MTEYFTGFFIGLGIVGGYAIVLVLLAVAAWLCWH